MRIPRRILVKGSVATLVLFLMCGKEKREMPVIVFGTDTLMADKVAALDPTGQSDSVRLRNVGVRIVCAGSLPDTVGDSVVRTCVERLLLVSGVEWNTVAVSLLYQAAQRLVEQTNVQEPCRAVQHFIDSLRQVYTKAVVSPGGAPPWHALSCEAVDLSLKSGKVWLVGTVLGLSPEVAGLLIEFVAAPAAQPTVMDDKKLEELVTGLVSSPKSLQDSVRRKAVAAKAKGEKQAVEQPDNSAEALRYRNQQSVRDSIEKHIPNLKQLYKKNLKIDADLAGKVIVTFRVAAGGAVINVSIKASEIDNMAFLRPFVAYLKTIRFKPIPEKIGAMKFDFPFEFNAEM